MKQLCPHCKTLVEIDESIYTNVEVVKIECPVCGEDMEFCLLTEKSIQNNISVPEKEVKPNIPLKEDSKTESLSPTPTKKEENKKPKPPKTNTSSRKKQLIVFFSILAAIILVCLYLFVYKPYKVDKDAPRLYVYADNLFVRSTKQGEVEHNIIDKAHYGSELIVYGKEGEWTHVKYNKKKGYVSNAFLMNIFEFNLLNSIWGNSDARETISSGKCRKALVDYYRRSTSNIDSSKWKYFSQGRKAKPNTVFYPRIYDRYSRFTDFCFVLKNKSTGEARLIIYSFDDNTEEPIFRNAYDITYCGSTLIKKIYVDKKHPDEFIVQYANSGKYSYVK